MVPDPDCNNTIEGSLRKNIHFLVMDVDGTLTDGKIYMGQSGEIFKAFNIKDGCGIGSILPRYSIIPVIITARESQIVINRCKELNIDHVYQSCHDKLSKLREVTNNRLDTVAYIGDDVLDLECMRAVKDAEGIVGCPADSVNEVKMVTDYICERRGGEGAVREFIEWIVSKINENRC